MMRRVLGPLMRMTAITGDIAAGNFAGRIPVRSADEVGQLARAFNRMAESLEKLENLRRSLMIDVAHELRTPLTNIRGYLEALNDGVLPPSPRTFSLLHEETLRLVQLVEDVLRLARADAASGDLSRTPLDLGQMVEAALAAFEPSIAQRVLRVSTSVEGPRDAAVVPADRDRIARVLRNLADNAVRYTPEGGAVTVRIDPGPESVRVTFSNPDAALRPEDLAFLFERFYRGEKSRSRHLGGAGIGLALVKELVEAHDGRVGAEKRDDTLAVWFELPRAEAV
jgi:signal transduction histidine kinase